MHFLHRNFNGCHPKTKELLYKAYARPILEYAGSVWDPHTQCNIEKLERVQRRAARFCTGTYSREERVTPLLQTLKWEPLAERRAKSKMTVWFKAKNEMIDIEIPLQVQPQRRTRSQAEYRVPFCRTNVYKNSFFNSGACMWNTLPTALRSSQSLPVFQKSISSLTIREKY